MTHARPHFDSLATDYARYRTGYSPELFARVLATSPVPRPRVLDLASGTGLSAAALAPHASRLVRADVAARMLRASDVGGPVVAAAEALPFRDGSFDLVTCAQAFHWMEPEPTFREMHRVLAEGGAAAVWWKLAAPGDEAERVTDAAFERATGEPAPHTSVARAPLAEPPAGTLAVESESFLDWRVPYSVDAYVGYQASRENFRRAAGALREAALAEVRRALGDAFPSGALTVAYVQRVIVLRKVERSAYESGTRAASR